MPKPWEFRQDMEFINRKEELKGLCSSDDALIVLFGRRRVGKTALALEYARRESNGSKICYSQAVEGAESLQIEQICEDFGDLLPKLSVPRWQDFFSLLSRVTERCILIIDEFPYLVKTQPSLPSLLQRWIDHHRPQTMRIILLGSSQTMMHDLFLDSHAPLYERAGEIIRLEPMRYKYFCQGLKLAADDEASYLKFSLVGGVPKYWDYAKRSKTVLELADDLYFSVGARLENEPDRLLKDENLVGEQAKHILELIGRGATRPSEMAGRLGIKQSSLSTPLQLLRNASLIQREVPFGESERSSKRTLYRVQDHCLSFWYGVYSPHRTRWENYPTSKKLKIIRDHASLMFERDVRAIYRDAARYWDANSEFDSVRYKTGDDNIVLVSEIKFRALSKRETATLKQTLKKALDASPLSKKYDCIPEVIGLHDGLRRLAFF